MYTTAIPAQEPLFPYTTLFRSLEDPRATMQLAAMVAGYFHSSGVQLVAGPTTGGIILAYEEIGKHTSELQSRGHLVCRLLLEKKKLQRTDHGHFLMPLLVLLGV